MRSVEATDQPARRLLPRGWRDFAFQLSLYVVVYFAYELVRGAADEHAVSEAFANARAIVGWERSLGIFTELDVQRWTMSHDWALDVANRFYFHAHFIVTTVFLFWLYFRRNAHYLFVRNVVFAADAVALAGYALFPTAPPRMLTGLGFVDTLELSGSVNHDSPAVVALANPYAAMPSVHTCYSLIIGASLIALAWPRVSRPLWAFYPGMIVFSIVATGNHFWLDAVAGGCLALTAFTVAWSLERLRPTLPASARARLRLPPVPVAAPPLPQPAAAVAAQSRANSS